MSGVSGSGSGESAASPGEFSTASALAYDAELSRLSFPVVFPSQVNQPPPALSFPPAPVTAKDQNSDPNIPLTVKRVLSLPYVPTGTHQKLGDRGISSSRM